MLTKVSESPPETRRYNKEAYPYYKGCPNTYIQGVAIGAFWFRDRKHKKRKGPSGSSGGTLSGGADDLLPPFLPLTHLNKLPTSSINLMSEVLY